MRSYAIGDIHGQLDLLRDAHERIAADRAAVGDTAAPVVHVGDLVDRGPDCRGVIDHLMSGIASGENWVVLKGNHDRMFTLFLNDPPLHDPRLRHDLSYLHPRIGGAATLASYGIASAADRPISPVHAEALGAVPPAHRRFLKELPVYHLLGEVMFVHAGIFPGAPLHAQTEDDLLWIRAEFLDDPRDHGVLVVHGHTAIDRATHYGNRVNLDSSAGYGGRLSAVVIEGRDVFELTDTGRVPLIPQPSARRR